MARFYPLYVRRSDGKKEVIAKGRVRERNEPSDSQLDQKPDKHGISDYYREVPPDGAKHTDWRRKLGGMMARELQWPKVNGDVGCILVDFPENYRLYEHIKKTEKDDGQTEVKAKTHAGGGNDRQDAYLYGHPMGRKKRFRSPADFFPHLLWLATDESGDPDTCTCKICSPDDLENVIPGVKAVKPMKQEPESKPLPVQTTAPTSRPGPQSLPPHPLSVQQNIPRPLASTPLPPPRSAEQQEDRQPHTFTYRPGEIVWFKRLQAWGLGTVTARRKSLSNPRQLSYTIQPLTYPSGPSVPVTKTFDTELRPWLAWSVPQFTHAGLNDAPEPPRFETADWDGMRQGHYGHTGDLEVDASILAAKSVDASYTPFHPFSTSEPNPGVTETHYAGLFLGAEKLWSGEPVRIVPGSGTDILVITAIIERRRANTPHPSCHLVGDIYTLTTVPHSNPDTPTPASPASNPNLPPRLTSDLGVKNMHSIHVKRCAAYWRLIASSASVDLNSVKGRWYEAVRLNGVLQGEGRLQEFAKAGEIPEASLYMNSRGDCLNANRSANLSVLPRANVRRSDRRAALGRAVPGDVRISHEGSEAQGDGGDNIDPALSSSSGGIGVAGRSGTGFDTATTDQQDDAQALSEFMDLDGQAQSQAQGAEMPGFGQEYGSQSHSQGFY